MVTISKYYSSVIKEGVKPSNPGNVSTDIPPVLNDPDNGDNTHLPVSIESPANGLSIVPSTQVLSIGLASSVNTGALSSADWNTFNNKQPAGNYVPYIGATGDVNLGSNNLTLDSLFFNDLPPNGIVPRQIKWNNDDHTMEIGMGLGGVVQQVGQEVYHSPVKNQTGVTIPDGSLVAYAGSVGISGRINIQLGIANGTIPSRRFLGVTTHEILNGEDGLVTYFGKVRGLNTTGSPVGETWALGDQLWAHPTQAGKLTNIEPLAPNLKISVGIVVDVHATTGTILVNSLLGSNLHDIHDVNVISPLNKHLINYDSATGIWKNSSLGTIIGGTTSQYLRGDGSLEDFGVSVRSAALTGYAVGANSALAATDSVLGAFGKIQGQINARVSGTGVSGQVAFWNGTNSQTGDSGLVWDNTNKRLALSTSVPEYKIDLGRLGVENSQDIIRFQPYNAISNTYGSGIIWKPYFTGYTKRSAGIIQVAEANFFRSGLAFFTNNSATQTGDWSERWRITMDGNLQSNGAQTIQTSTGNLTLQNNALNVNIGLTDGTERLEIGNRTSVGSDSRAIRINRGVTGQYALLTALGGATNLHSYNGAGGAILFWGEGIERARIDSSGRLLINQTSGTQSIDTAGNIRIRSLTTTEGDFVQADTTGVFQRRTAAQVSTQIVHNSTSLKDGGDGTKFYHLGQDKYDLLNNSVISSVDTWISRVSAANNTWNSVAFGNNLFVAVSGDGTNNRVMTSPDGINWTIRTSAANNTWNSVTFGNNLFVAVSTDGIGNRVMTSPDGITWTVRTSASDIFWDSVTFGNNLFVAVGQTGNAVNVMTSPDGINWTGRTGVSNPNWISVTFGNNLFVAVSPTGTNNRVMTSPDGITWTVRTSVQLPFISITFGNNLFVAVGDSCVMTSPDGITWTGRTPSANNQWNSVTFGNGLFVAVSQTGTGNRVMTCPDGITWTSKVSAADNAWSSVTFGNNTFVSVSFNGSGNRVMTSGLVLSLTHSSLTLDDGVNPHGTTLDSLVGLTKGGLVEGTAVTLSGTLTNRLLGTGNVTINVAEERQEINSSGRLDNITLNDKTTLLVITGTVNEITGLNAGGRIRRVSVVNLTSDFINFTFESANSSVGNRLRTSFGAAVYITVELIYDPTTGFWYKIGN
ncbi:MAG TPA: hypothetical protein VIH28_08390 [Ignavibacteriaceae bacterium]